MKNYVVDVVAYFEDTTKYKKISFDFDTELPERVIKMDALLVALKFGLRENYTNPQPTQHLLPMTDLIMTLYDILLLSDNRVFNNYANGLGRAVLWYKNIFINIEEVWNEILYF